ncbi:PD-(D/E)XK nuclease-like domain-containing protein [Robbsia andropogonis]|nr:PD-(D/E)XK nuclease-like domain-containing protein [Robbsia andropogonis]
MDRAPFMPHIDPSMSIEDYHSRTTEVSKSGLDLIAQSAAKFYAWTFDPARLPRATKAGQLEGSLAHAAILEPHEFDKRYVVGPKVTTRATKEWKAFEETLSPGQIGIKPEQHATAMHQAESVRRISDVRDVLDSGRPEVSAFWKDADTAALCRCRPDWVHPYSESAVLLDVKTYSDASPAEFKRQIARKRYHVQAAFYSDGYEAAAQTEVRGFLFLAVETEWPYAASVVMLDEASIAAGRDLYKRDLSTYQRCIETGVWPGYGDGISIETLPAWAFKQIDEE